jgi:hypothetical protein
MLSWKNNYFVQLEGIRGGMDYMVHFSIFQIFLILIITIIRPGILFKSMY